MGGEAAPEIIRRAGVRAVLQEGTSPRCWPAAASRLPNGPRMK